MGRSTLFFPTEPVEKGASGLRISNPNIRAALGDRGGLIAKMLKIRICHSDALAYGEMTMKVLPKVICAALLAFGVSLTTLEKTAALPLRSAEVAEVVNVEQAGWARETSRCSGCPTGRCYGWPGFYPYYCEPVYQEPDPYYGWLFYNGRGGQRDYW
jgi:hypothetical protein